MISLRFYRSLSLFYFASLMVASVALADTTLPPVECFGAQTPVPVSVPFTPKEGQDLSRLAVFPEYPPPLPSDKPIPAQFDMATGRLWWMLPAGVVGGPWKFKLLELNEPAPAAFVWDVDEETQYYTLNEGDSLVLRYNFGDVPMPEGRVPNHFGDGRPYGGARSDYIHPLYGFEGEELTEDYPEHPHHRGVWWSWPIIRWGERTADIWAVCDVWARPSEMKRVKVGPVFALLEAENVWNFGVDEQHPIVQERLVIRIFRTGVEIESRQRLIDVDIELTALEDDVAIGGRPGGGYGGFALRAIPAENQTIRPHVENREDVEGRPPRAWCDYGADFPGSARRTSLVLLQHRENPEFPTEHLVYPQLNAFMPAFPGDKEHPLSKDEPLVLKHRILIRVGPTTTGSIEQTRGAYNESLEQAWDAYNQIH